MTDENLAKTRLLTSLKRVLHLNMRRCSHCQQVYDDSLNFCLSDGTSLTSDSDPALETIIISSPVVSHGRQIAKPGVNPMFAYLSIGLVALLIGGGLVLWLKSDKTASLRANNTPVTTVSPSNEQPKPALNSQSTRQARNRAVWSEIGKGSRQRAGQRMCRKILPYPRHRACLDPRAGPGSLFWGPTPKMIVGKPISACVMFKAWAMTRV